MTFKFISVAVAAVLSATVAQATDLPNKKAPPAGPVAKNISLFDGAYIGGSLGAGMTLGDTSSLSGDELRRAIPGVYAGYNHLLTSQFVVGVEADANYMGFEDVTSDQAVPGTDPVFAYVCTNKQGRENIFKTKCPNGWTGGLEEVTPGEGGIAGYTASFSVRDLDTLRVRAGYLVQNNVMLFATIGLGVAYAELSTDDGTGPVSSSGYHSGFVYGGGLEYAHSKDISFKVDYLHYDLGSIDDTINTVDLVGHMVRAGVAYHF